MSDTRGVTDRAHTPWARLLILAGAATMMVSAAVGYVWLTRMPDLEPVAFGQQAQIRATESTSATIFASTGMSQPPSCEVTSGNGDPVAAGAAERYLQEGGLESAFGFPMASGSTYTVTCTSTTDAGRFAVAQDRTVPEGAFLVAGLLGLVVCGLGVVLAARQRR